MNISVRLCVMEGSSEAAGRQPGETVLAGHAESALDQASNIWEREADIHFVSMQVRADSDNYVGVPIIKDMSAPPNSIGELGDVDVAFPFEASDEAILCREAWRHLDSDANQGIVGVIAREFVNGGGTLGGASHPAFGLWTEGAHVFGGKRGDDLCGHPRMLNLADVIDGWVILPQREEFQYQALRVRTLAHELGHALALGHGNGIDDNGDGEPAGVPGPRRYDQYCDPDGTGDNGLPIEDGQTQDPTCGISLSMMQPSSTGCTRLSELQAEQAYEVAALLPHVQ